jgi:hypothetical protein
LLGVKSRNRHSWCFGILGHQSKILISYSRYNNLCWLCIFLASYYLHTKLLMIYLQLQLPLKFIHISGEEVDGVDYLNICCSSF